MHKGKKVHPHGLPHMNDARHEDGSTDRAAFTAGQAAWQAKIDAGEYTVDPVHEEAITDDVDILTFKRTKVAK